VDKILLKFFLLIVIVGIPSCLLCSSVSTIMVLGYNHDEDPQAYNSYIAENLGVQGITDINVDQSSYNNEDELGRLRSTNSSIPVFHIIYWNGNSVLFYADPVVWEAVVEANLKYPWCSPAINIATAFSESSQYINYTMENSATAMGVWQFTRSTWSMMWPDPISRPVRTNIAASADAACRYLKMTGVFDATNEAEFINAFAVNPPVWNAHVPQAEFVWRLSQQLNGVIGPVDLVPTSWKAYDDWWTKTKIAVLKAVGLWPEGLGETVYIPGPTIPPEIIDGFTDPYPGSYLCGYGYGSWGGRHHGVDLCTGSGYPWTSSPVVAAHAGIVTFSGFVDPLLDWNASIWWCSGNVVWVKGLDDQNNTIETCYCHGSNNSVQVKVGDVVQPGTRLMMSGTTGFSNGIHLHFGMKINSEWVNPADYLSW
jgi:murein DD-endopeptidase MepM/ murein hydrolase activator NlpD